VARRRRFPPLEPPAASDGEPVNGEPSVLPENPEQEGVRPGEVHLSETEITALVTEFADAISYECGQRTQREQDWERWERVYRASPDFKIKEYPWRGASGLNVPTVFSFVNQVLARILQAVFGIEPHWSVTQLNRKFAPAAKPLERYLDWVRDVVWNQRKVVKLFTLELCKLGTAVLFQGWKNEQCYRYDDITKRTIPSGKKYGPAPRWVSLPDFLIPSGYADPQTAPWVAMRDWFSYEQLQDLAKSRYFEPVEKLKGQPDSEPTLRKERRADHVESSPRTEDGMYGPWTVFFARDLDNDGYAEQYILTLHAATATLLRLRANPYVSGMRPFVVARFIEVEGEFYGVGIPEMLHQLQDELSTIHNQRRDNAHLSNIRMYKARMGATIPDTIRPQSGKVIKLMDVNDLVEWRLGDNRQVDIYEEQTVQSIMRDIVGLTDLGSGNMTSPAGRAAATTVMALLQEGTRRFDLNTSELRLALSEQGHQVVELYQTHGLPAPEDSGSPEQVLDEEDAALVRAVIEIPEDIRGLVVLKLNIATQAINREVEKQSNVQLYELLSRYSQQILQYMPVLVNPQIPPDIRQAVVKIIQGQDKMLDRVFQAFGAFDLEDVLVGDAYAQLAAAIPQQQQLMPPGPGAGGGNGMLGEPPPRPPLPEGANGPIPQ
jgi:hypothetical protein